MAEAVARRLDPPGWGLAARLYLISDRPTKFREKRRTYPTINVLLTTFWLIWSRNAPLLQGPPPPHLIVLGALRLRHGSLPKQPFDTRYPRQLGTQDDHFPQFTHLTGRLYCDDNPHARLIEGPRNGPAP